MKSSYKEKFRLRISDFDQYDNLNIHTMLDLFQDVAGKHASLIGVGYEEMLRKDLIWVLIRTRLDIIQTPDLYSTVVVNTWPKESGRMDFDREYEIYNSKNELCVKAISKWVVVNYKTRRLSFARDVKYNCKILNKTNYSEGINKLQDFNTEGFDVFETKAEFLDFDHNGHVNNISYAKFISNALKLDKNSKISSFEINYIKELKDNENVILHYKNHNNTYFVKASANNEVIFIAELKVL